MQKRLQKKTAEVFFLKTIEKTQKETTTYIYIYILYTHTYVVITSLPSINLDVARPCISD